jgi:hypothetical protein
VDPDDRPFMFIMDSAHYANGSPRTNRPKLRFLMIVLIWMKYQDLYQTRIKLEAMYDVFLINKTKSSSQICIDVPVWQEDKTYDNGIFLFQYFIFLIFKPPKFTELMTQYSKEIETSTIVGLRKTLKETYMKARNKCMLTQPQKT